MTKYIYICSFDLLNNNNNKTFLTGFKKFTQILTQHCYLKTVLQCSSVSAWMHFRPFFLATVFILDIKTAQSVWDLCFWDAPIIHMACPWLNDVRKRVEFKNSAGHTEHKSTDFLIGTYFWWKRWIVLQCPSVTDMDCTHSYGHVKYSLIQHLYILKHKCFDFYHCWTFFCFMCFE